MTISKGVFALAMVCTVLSACYVVPLQPYPPAQENPHALTVPPLLVSHTVYTARLYPVNDSASAMGRISGTISSSERGHGEFSFSVNNETFVGEATREPNSSKGIANAIGNRGGYVKCEYAMSSTALGMGTCNFSNGARFDIHISL